MVQFHYTHRTQAPASEHIGADNASDFVAIRNCATLHGAVLLLSQNTGTCWPDLNRAAFRCKSCTSMTRAAFRRTLATTRCCSTKQTFAPSSQLTTARMASMAGSRALQTTTRSTKCARRTRSALTRSFFRDSMFFSSFQQFPLHKQTSLSLSKCTYTYTRSPSPSPPPPDDNCIGYGWSLPSRRFGMAEYPV